MTSTLITARALLRLAPFALFAFLCAPHAMAGPYYDVQVVPQTGHANSDGDVLTALADDGSINDRGSVAFIGRVAAGESVYTVNGTGAPVIVSFAPGSRDYSKGLRIN